MPKSWHNTHIDNEYCIPTVEESLELVWKEHEGGRDPLVDVLGELLDNDRSIFLYILDLICGDDVSSLILPNDDIRIEPEVTLQKVNTDNGETIPERIIDIKIESPGLLVFIEIKFKFGTAIVDNSEQLLDFRRHLDYETARTGQKGVLVFLTFTQYDFQAIANHRKLDVNRAKQAVDNHITWNELHKKFTQTRDTNPKSAVLNDIRDYICKLEKLQLYVPRKELLIDIQDKERMIDLLRQALTKLGINITKYSDSKKWGSKGIDCKHRDFHCQEGDYTFWCGICPELNPNCLRFQPHEFKKEGPYDCDRLYCPNNSNHKKPTYPIVFKNDADKNGQVHLGYLDLGTPGAEEETNSVDKIVEFITNCLNYFEGIRCSGDNDR